LASGGQGVNPSGMTHVLNPHPVIQQHQPPMPVDASAPLSMTGNKYFKITS
jgi:hypothetical protein